MAFQLAQAYVELQARGFRSVMGSIGEVKKGLGSIVSMATGPLGAALAGVGAGIGVAGMISMAANAEQLAVSFETMLGSADAGKKMLSDLTKFAAKTPFELPGVTQAARTLMSFGHSQEQILPLLKVLGDVSSGTGKDLAEMAGIFGQISASGKLMGQELLQLTNAGVPILKVLGTQLGKTTGQIRKMVEDGKISSGMVTKAFQTMGAEGGLFAGLMEKQSKTLGGLWSTLKDSVGLGAIALGQALIDGFDLKNVVANFTSFVDKTRNEWMPDIVASVRWAGDNFIKPFFSAIGTVTQAIFTFVRDLDIYWSYATTSIGNWMNNVYQIVATGMSNAWTITKWFFSNFFGIAQNVLMNLPKLFMQYIEQIKNNWTSLLNFIATGKLEFDFTPLKEAAELAFKGIEMPKLEVAQTDALQSDLDALAGRLAKRQADRQAKQLKDQASTNDLKMAELKIEEGKTKEAKKQDSFSSLAELADKMQQSLLGKDGTASRPAGAVIANAGSTAVVNQAAGQSARVESVSRQVSLLESLLTLAQGQGLRVVSQEGPGQIKLPATSVQFGAQGV